MSRSPTLCAIAALLATLLPVQAQSAEKTLKIYHDTDYANHRDSAESMRMGFLTALDEIDNKIQGFSLELVKKDHHGNSVRSKRHLQQFLDDPQGLFVLGGLHSPPYIRYRDFINENGVLLLVPWAAGGPITRYDKGRNWVFRVSIDDTKAGFRISRFAVEQLGCKTPYLLLEDTPWGRSNQRTLNKAIGELLDQEPAVRWFNWGIQENTARIALRDIARAPADCVLFVGNAVEGKVFSRAMHALPAHERVPIVSHWGITGGDFHRAIDSQMRQSLDLHFIQTCFSFLTTPLSPLAQSVFERAKRLFPERIQNPEDIPAPPGFIHAYDLGRLVIAALQQIELSGDIARDRALLRDALEHLNAPLEGLVKTYQTPFSPWAPEHDDAHEALGLDDFCMARYSDRGILVKANQPGSQL